MDPMHLKPIERGTLLANLFSSVAFRVFFSLSLLVAMILIPVTYWALDYQRPYMFILEGSRIVPTEANGNDQMIVSWNVRTARECDGSVRRELFDPHTQVVLALYDPQPSPKTSAPATFLLPRQIQPGKIGYRARLEFWCNPLQRIWPIVYYTPDLFFTVRQ